MEYEEILNLKMYSLHTWGFCLEFNVLGYSFYYTQFCFYKWFYQHLVYRLPLCYILGNIYLFKVELLSKYFLHNARFHIILQFSNEYSTEVLE